MKFSRKKMVYSNKNIQTHWIMLLQKNKIFKDTQEWSHTLKRLREVCPLYVTSKKDGTKRHKKESSIVLSPLTLERFLKHLLSAMETTNLELKPCVDCLQLLKQKINAEVFTIKTSRIKDLIQKYNVLPIHDDIKNFLLQIKTTQHATCLQEDELQFWTRLKLVLPKEWKISKELFERNLRFLKKLRNKYNFDSKYTCETIGKIEPIHAYEFCSGYSYSVKPEFRMYMLLQSGFNILNLEQLQKGCQEYTKFCSNAQILAIEMNVKMDVIFRECYLFLNYLLQKDIQEVFEQKDNMNIITKIILETKLKNPEVTKKIIYFLADKYNQKDIILNLNYNEYATNIDKFGSMSNFHDQIVKELIDRESKNFRSSYPLKHVIMIKFRFGTFGLFLDQKARAKINQEENSLELFLKQLNLDELIFVIQEFIKSRKVCNDRVKSQVHQHHGGKHVSFCLRFIKGVLKKYLHGCKSKLQNITPEIILCDIQNQRIPADGSQRRTFTDDEIQKMFNVTSNPIEDLILTLLVEIGLRVGAISYLKYQCLLDKNHEPLHECSVTEKFNKQRRFITSPNLKSKIKKASEYLILRYTDTDMLYKLGYILNLKNIEEPLPKDSIANFLKRLAKDANIFNVHVHPHAFRHTLVTKLCLLNPVDIVAKFIGHDDSRTTSYFYFKPTTTELYKQLKNPFDCQPNDDINIKKLFDVVTNMDNEIDPCLEIEKISTETTMNDFE